VTAGASSGSAARRGRPRSESARRAILAAAAELLLERGLYEATTDALAERAGVSKATIYRWWPSKEMLALDALFADSEASLPDSGSLRQDLLVLFGPWVRRVRKRPYARVVAALVVEAQRNPQFAQLYEERVVQPQRKHVRPLLTRAIARRQIAAHTNIELVLDCVYGPLYHRLLHRRAPLTERFLRDVVAVALAGVGADT
jgi:AcrR family transcriptional regulator